MKRGPACPPFSSTVIDPPQNLHNNIVDLRERLAKLESVISFKAGETDPDWRWVGHLSGAQFVNFVDQMESVAKDIYQRRDKRMKKAAAEGTDAHPSLDDRLSALEKRVASLPFDESGELNHMKAIGGGAQFYCFVRRMNKVAEIIEQADYDKMMHNKETSALLVLLEERLRKAEETIKKTDETIEKAKKAFQLL